MTLSKIFRSKKSRDFESWKIQGFAIPKNPGIYKSRIGISPSFFLLLKMNFPPYISLILNIHQCPIHVVTFTLISNLVSDYIQKRKGEPGLFSFEYNLLPKLISNFNQYMDRALLSLSFTLTLMERCLF